MEQQPRHVFAMITTKYSAHYTDHALASLFDTTPMTDHDNVLLIDNDASYELPQHSWSDRVEVVRNSSPKGFAQNANYAIERAMKFSAHLFLLNNDLIFPAGWMGPMVAHPHGIASPLSNRELQLQGDNFRTSVSMQLDEYLGSEEKFAVLAKTLCQSQSGRLRVLALPFFCVRLPLEVITQVGFFDEQYGRGGAEDYDYCLRAVLEGFSLWYALDAYVLHFGGKSSWSGVETRGEQHEREERFSTLFRAKWGDTLTDLVLLDDHSVVHHDARLLNALQAGDYQMVAQTLRATHQGRRP